MLNSLTGIKKKNEEHISIYQFDSLNLKSKQRKLSRGNLRRKIATNVCMAFSENLNIINT